MLNRIIALLTLTIWIVANSIGFAQDTKKPFTFEDVMKFKSHSDVTLSSQGNYLGFNFWPDRGDGEVIVVNTNKPKEHLLVVDLGKNATFSEDESYVAVQIKPSIYLTEAPNKSKNKKYFDSLAVFSLNENAAKIWAVDSLKNFAFTADGKHIAVHRQAQKFKDVTKKYGSDLWLYNLASQELKTYSWVESMSMDSTGTHLILALADTSGTENKLMHIDLSNAYQETILNAENDAFFAELSWHHDSHQMAFTKAIALDENTFEVASLHLLNAANKRLKEIEVDANKLSANNFILHHEASLSWSQDGKRLFFGLQPNWVFEAINAVKAEEDSTLDVYDVDEILEGKTVDVWHTEDPMIKTHEKKQWRNTKAARLHVVYHIKDRKQVVLGEPESMLSVQRGNQSTHLLASDNDPYMKDRTWDGWYSDRYVVDLNTGSSQLITKRHSGDIELSPNGQRVVYFQDSTWHSIKIDRKGTKNVDFKYSDEAIFYDEDHDYPSQVPSYGFAAWVGENQAIVYDKYDLLLLNLDNAMVSNLTNKAGREQAITYRLLTDSRDPLKLKSIDDLTLIGYDNKLKSNGLYVLDKMNQIPKLIFHEDKKWSFAAKSSESDRWIFTREDYHEYPDFYRIDESNLSEYTQLTDLHPEIDDFAWGRSELVEWTNLDGRKMQGVVIKPGNYEEGKKYPVLVYYYRFFSQRLHEFNIPRVNHRPAFPLWASDDYLIFLPDIRFEVGTPGPASVRSLVPGVQKIIELGYADPENIGLHGHSWSGYQTAHIVTETDIFKAAIAGAPVSNMTSAYGGIRWGSGLSRAFQYEKTQSRLGVSMWENLQPYIENSPVFFADRINTPMLIIHGDADGAVPWYQSIELYIALRRLGKEAVFLQYHGEDHHPGTYPNKLDWAMRMKEYFDHYLKGKPAPEWISKGVRYTGK